MKRRLHAKRDKYAHEKRCSITFLNKTSRFFDLTDRHIFHDKSFLRSRRFIQDRDFFLWHHLEDGNRFQVGLLLRRNKSDFRSILSSYGLSYPKYPQYVVSLTNTKNRGRPPLWNLVSGLHEKAVLVFFSTTCRLWSMYVTGAWQGFFSKGEGSGKLCHT